MTPEKIIEALLFFKGEPVSVRDLARLAELRESDIRTAAEHLGNTLRERGIILINDGESLALSTHPDMHERIQTLIKEEREGPLSKASLETLSVIVYHGPLSKPDIDYIRGVNSQFILRHLAMRGLIIRVPHPKDARTHLYKPSIELLAHCGISNQSEMPEYGQYRETIGRALAGMGGEKENNA